MNFKSIGFVFVVFMLFLNGFVGDVFGVEFELNGYDKMDSSKCDITYNLKVSIPQYGSADKISYLEKSKPLTGNTASCMDDYDDHGLKYSLSYYCEVTESSKWYVRDTKTLYRDKCAVSCDDSSKRCSDNTGSTDTISSDDGESSTAPKYYSWLFDGTLKNGVCTSFDDSSFAFSSLMDKSYNCFEFDDEIISYYCDGGVIYSRTCPTGSKCSTGGKYLGQCVKNAVPDGYKRITENVDSMNNKCYDLNDKSNTESILQGFHGCSSHEDVSYFCSSNYILSKKDCDFGCELGNGLCKTSSSTKTGTGSDSASGSADTDTSNDDDDGAAADEEDVGSDSKVLATFKSHSLLFKMSKESKCNSEGYTCKVRSDSDQSTLYYCNDETKFYTLCPTSKCNDGDNGGCEMIKMDDSKPIMTITGKTILVTNAGGMNYIAYKTLGVADSSWDYHYCDGKASCEKTITSEKNILVSARALNGKWSDFDVISAGC